MRLFLVFVVVLVVTTAVIRLARRRQEGSQSGLAAPPRPSPSGADPPAPDLELAVVTGKIEAFLRHAYLPVLAEGDPPPTASKFSGVPWLAPGEAWPPCGNCGRPMQLFVQLAVDDLPEPGRERIGAGNALQLFYCTHSDTECDVECNAWEPHSHSTLVRIVAMDGAAQDVEMPTEMFPPKTVVDWDRVEDFPNFEELEERGVVLSDEEVDLVSAAYPTPGEKLLGWPLWVQGVEYPECRRCGARMALLFQMDSEHTLPWIFGDVGIGHVTQCPNHPQEVAFGWACY